eukprot:gene3121-3399_t
MGACCSTAEDTAGSKTFRSPSLHAAAVSASEQQQHPKATAAVAGIAVAATDGSRHDNGNGALGSKQQQQERKQRKAKIDLSTGELVPDFSVQGSFDVLHELGSGGSGQTYLCRDMASSKVVAVKFVPRPLSKAAIPFMLNEVEIQAKLGGCLTSEVSGLWESALSRGGLFMGEQEASYYMRQFVQAMAYCHKNQLVGPPHIKLCDFGFAKQWSGGNSHMDTAIGTPVYMSPQEKRISTAELVHHPWLALQLSPEQQLTWQALQDEQQKLTHQLEAVRDPRLVKMRKEAMLAMMAIAAKSPSATLFPGPNGNYASSNHPHPACNSNHNTALGHPIAQGKAACSGHIPDGAQLLDVAGCCDCAADQHQQVAGGCATTGRPVEHMHKQHSEMLATLTSMPDPPTPVKAAASAFAAAATVPEEDEEGNDISAVSDAVGSRPPVVDDARHFSFQTGEGLRSSSLEEKVDRYRQQAADIRAARMAAMAEAATVGSQQQGAGLKLQPAGSSASDAVSGTGSVHSTGGGPADGISRSGITQLSPHASERTPGKHQGKLLDGLKKKKKHLVNSKVSSSSKHKNQGLTNLTSTTGKPAAAIGAEGLAVAAPDPNDLEQTDELWRLPLTTVVDPSVFKLKPELAVAAGALIRQLQGSSKVPGRGRTNRSSCPM